MSVAIAMSNGRCPCRNCQKIRAPRGRIAREIERAIDEGLIPRRGQTVQFEIDGKTFEVSL